MTQTTQQTLTPAEIARVFALYLGQRYRHPHSSGIISGINYDNRVFSSGLSYPCIMKNCKILLTPLERITDEDKQQLCRMRGVARIATLQAGILYSDEYQFLISRGYAVPLWFGVGHWANGKTALELGIAVEKETI